MGTSTIMVVVGDRKWTLAAIHLACAVAQGNGSEITLPAGSPLAGLPAPPASVSGRCGALPGRDIPGKFFLNLTMQIFSILFYLSSR